MGRWITLRCSERACHKISTSLKLAWAPPIMPAEVIAVAPRAAVDVADAGGCKGPHRVTSPAYPR